MLPCNIATVNIHGMFQRKYMTLCVLFLFQQLSESLDAFGYKWEINPGDGAFYGPKVRQIYGLFRSINITTCVYENLVIVLSAIFK